MPVHSSPPARRVAAAPDRGAAIQHPARAGRTARQAYDRGRDLCRLLPVWPAEIEDTSLEGRQRLILKIERALRAERRRGLAGHWTYDLARHAALYDAWQEERASLDEALARE